MRSEPQPAVAADAAPQTTAGFRNAEWTLTGLPAGTQIGVFPLRTADGAVTNGFLYRRASSKLVVCIMHPREFLATHYMIPPLLEAGAAVFTQTPRAVGNDLRLEHEIALLDVAAGMQFLRSSGFEQVVLLGNSGGASLYGFYNQQSLLAPGERIERTPAGRPTGLNEASLPQVDGLVLLSPHPGQGILLMSGIDPSVREETDPCSSDPALDPFNPANGFAEPPLSSRYSVEFVTRYRAAQRERVERLDARARELLAARRDAAKRVKAGDTQARVRAALQDVMTIWRTDADLRNWDLSLDPSARAYGSLWGRDPFKSNWGSMGFARLCTPESWLSTWSGLSSNASLEKTTPAIQQPTLMIRYEADQVVFPEEATRAFQSIGAADKVSLALPGNHHGLGTPEGVPTGRELAGRAISDWLADRFGVGA